VSLLAVSAALVVLALPAPSALALGRCGNHAWCNTVLSPSTRAQLLLAAMSQADKVGILTGQAAGDVGLPAIKFTDGAVGAGGAGSGGSGATAMPAGIALAANFDQPIAQRYGAVVGTEVRHRGFDGDWGPTVNIMRTPLGGRTFEGYGEDPFLDARTAVGWIEGLQAQGVMADVKHFAANNQEGQIGVSPISSGVGGRLTVDAKVDQRTLQEIEFPAFEAAVTEAHSATVMCSYNLLNGTYACANPSLLHRALRQEWGFPGFVFSDAGACHETSADLNAGLDFDILDTCYTRPQVDVALADGSVSEKTLDARVLEILRTLFSFGFFDHPTWPSDTSQDNRTADAAAAEVVAERGSVLLKNRGLLPIDPRRVHSIAVIGAAANQYIFGNGSSKVTPYSTTNALQGIELRARQAGIRVSYDDGTNVQQAQALARRSDLAIVVAADTEGEGVDKPCMSLTPQCSGGQAAPPSPQVTQLAFGDQDSLISNIADANPHTGVVLETGAPVLTPWRARIGALLEAWYPGQAGGTAIARILFGDVDPGGRLPVTFPQKPGDLPTAPGGAAQYPGVIDATSKCTVDVVAVPCPFFRETYREGVMVGYRWYDSQHIAPAFPFGFGLSYTTFRYRDLRVTHGVQPRISVAITNTGARAGWATPQLYISLPSLPGVPEPPQQLKSFAKAHLAPGQSRTVTMPLNARSFSYWSGATSGWRIARGCDKVSVGRSSRDLPLRAVLARGGAHCRLGARRR
jgi:beta-glucosidase